MNQSNFPKLLPHRFQKLGYLCTVITIVVFTVLIVLDIIELSAKPVNLSLFLCMLLSLSLVAVSREKQDDEMVKQVRERLLAYSFIFFLLLPVVADTLIRILSDDYLYQTPIYAALPALISYVFLFKLRLSQLKD